MRTTIDLPEDQARRLAEYTARHGILRAEAVRRAIEKLLAGDEETERDRLAILAATFGAWKHLKIDAAEHLRALRAEWEREWDPD